MVRTIILSRFNDPPPVPGQDRKIKGGPLYAREDVLALLDAQGAEAIIAWTRSAIADLQRLNLADDELVELVRNAITTGNYHDSEWCERHPDGPWAACDAYRFNYREWFPAAHKHITCEYYLKLALGKTGIHLLVISCHPS